MDASIKLPNGNQFRIVADTCMLNPRTEYDPLCTMVLEHRNYTVAKEYKFHLCEYNTADEAERALIKEVGPCIISPVYMYDHGNVVLSMNEFSDRWDSGLLGFIFCTKEQLRKEYGWKRITKERQEKVFGYMKTEVREYSDYLSGNGYGYVIEDETGEQIIEAYGFYGDDFKNNVLLADLPDDIRPFVESAL